jgi:hypothetical protein
MSFTNYKYTIFSEKNKGTLENAPLPIYVLCFFQIENLTAKLQSQFAQSSP